MVLERILETKKVMQTPSRMKPVSRIADPADWANPPDTPTKNIDKMAISVGKRPLQGTKLFVIIAISRSRGESMIRQPTIPAALHPNPMHIDNINMYYIITLFLFKQYFNYTKNSPPALIGKRDFSISPYFVLC